MSSNREEVLVLSKAEQRHALMAARDELGAAERNRVDALIAQTVKSLPAYARASTVFSYLSFGAEVDTRELIEDAWSSGKTVALPYCVPGTRLMEWHEVTSFDNLVTSCYGIDEPAPDPETLIDPAAYPDSVALVPGLSFNAQGLRLGYGGGFYDIFLSDFAGVSVGLCRNAFFDTVALALEPHDVPVQFVATDAGVVEV